MIMMKRLREVFFAPENRQVNDRTVNKMRKSEVKAAMKRGIGRSSGMFRIAHLALVAVFTIALGLAGYPANVEAATLTAGAGTGTNTTAANGGGNSSWAQYSGALTDITSSNNTGVGAYTNANNSSAISHYLDATNFNFSAIPAGATITGIQVTIRRQSNQSGGNQQDMVVQLLKAGNPVGSNLADTVTNWPNTWTNKTYGNTSEMWGTTWTATDVKNSNFGVRLQVDGSSTTNWTLAEVDYISITVNYSTCSATAPSDLNATAVSLSQVDLTWTYDGTNNDYYTIFRDGSPIASNITTGSYSDTTVAPGTSYVYTVQGHSNAQGCDSSDSNQASVTTPSCTDSTPSSIIWNGTNSASGDFSGSSFITASDIQAASMQYKVTQGSGSGTPFPTQTDDFAGLANGTKPNFGNWTGVNGSDGTNGWVVLSGATGSSNGPNAGNPDPYVYLESSGTNQTYGVGVAAGSSQYIESNVLDASTYAFTFTFDWDLNIPGNTDASLHVDGWNGSTWVNDVTGSAIQTGDNGDTWVTSGPIDLSSFTNADFKIRIRYIVGSAGNVYDNDAAVDNLVIAGTPRSTETTVIDWTPAGVDTITASGVLTNGNTYNLYVRGLDGDCGINMYYGDPSVANTTADGVPTTFSWIDCNVSSAPTVSVTGVTDTSVTLSWPAVTGASSYMVNGTDIGNVLTYTVTGLAANTAYSIDVDGVGTASCAGPVSTVAATTLPAAPAAPTYANPTSSSVDVSWSAVGGTEPVTYALTQVGGSTINPATSPVTVNGLSPNTAYQFYVNATNAGGTGANSTASTAPYTLAVVPGAPTVSGATSNSLNVALGTDSNSAATTYAIRINGGSYTNQYVQSNGSVGATAAWQTKTAWGTTTVTGLTLGTSYSFDVKARNGDAVETTFGTSAALSTLTAVAVSTGSTVGVTTGDGLISVTAAYSGDFPTNNNTVLFQWQLCGDVNAVCDGTTFTNGSTTQGPAASPYNYDIIGLTNGNKYQVRITLSDPDGTTAGPGWSASGADITYVVTDVIPSVEMLHNAASTGSTKWGGTWGLPGGKYGAFSCNTCHTDTTTNIKRIKQSISFPDGSIMPNGSTSSSVTLSDTRDNTSDYADASGAHATSNGVCEVCHTYDGTQANGVHHHGYDMSGATAGDQNHFLQLDCMTCHNHKSGFLPTACDSCHGNPPTTPDTDGSTNTGLVHTTPTGSTTPGAHNRHVNDANLSFKCATCHNGNVMPNGGDIDIHFNADFSATGGGTSSAGSYGGQTGVSYNGLPGDGTKACSNVYCHGGTIGGTAPTWDGTVACGDCHGASQASPPTTGSHQVHVGQVGAACTDCHGASAGAAGHMNGNVHWDVTAAPNTGTTATYNGFTTGDTNGLAPSASYGSCSNVSCHYGKDTPVWGSTGITCDACHGQGPNIPWPNIGAHNAHFAALGITTLDSTNEATVRAVCDDCHSGATHNGVKEVSVSATYNAMSGAASWSGSQCSNVSCHGGKITPSWASGVIDVNTQCTSCHTAETTATQYNSATSGMHGITGAISGMNHGSTLACTDCHNGPPAGHFSDAGLKTSAMSRPVGTDFSSVNGTITLGATSDDDTCAMTCHKEGADANRGTSAPWARLNNKTWASGAGATGDECKTCHGIWGSWRGNVLVDHTADWDGDGTPEVQANHSECQTCHGFAPGGKYNANYNPTWGTGDHGNGTITMNGPSPSTGAGYNQANWGCDNACHGNASTGHAMADSTWTVGFGDFGAGSCDVCHGPGGSGPTVVWPANNSGFTGEGYGSHLKAATTDTFSAATDWSVQCKKCHGFHSGDVQIPNNPTVGINYTLHGGINLGGTATSAKTTEAEICWTCHDANGVSEWGTNTNANTGSSPYNYGTLSTSNWTTATWTSGTSYFAYKTGAIESTHSVNDAETTGGVDPVADIRCSYCHDVHNTAGKTWNPAGALAGDVDGKPYLRGTWMGNPYKEDGAPQSTAAGGAAYSNLQRFGAVPRGSTTQTAANGGYWIDANSGNPTTGWTLSSSAGLCTLCHGTNVDTMNKFGTAASAWVGTNGHSNAVIGGTGSAKANIFDLRGGSTGNRTNPAMAFTGASDPGDSGNYGFRGTQSRAAGFSPNTNPASEGRSYRYVEWTNATSGATISIDGTTTETQFHKFSCSKCHNPHASRLPRLMITNCLDTKHNTWDDGLGTPTSANFGNLNNGRHMSNWTSSQNCHRVGDPAEGANGAGWNLVTPWTTTGTPDNGTIP